MRGASALQSVLDEIPTADLTVLVVWEPVIFTDWSPPSDRVLSRLSDPRAVQFWDGGRRVSRTLVDAAASVPGVLGEVEYGPGDIVWDFVAIYPPGVLWETSPPAASFGGAPVVEVIQGVRERLRLGTPRPSSSHGLAATIASLDHR